MAKVLPPDEPHIAFRLQSDHRKDWELSLIKGGRRRSYLWTPMGTYSGPETLRKLAMAILKEIPARKK